MPLGKHSQTCSRVDAACHPGDRPEREKSRQEPPLHRKILHADRSAGACVAFITNDRATLSSVAAAF